MKFIIYKIVMGVLIIGSGAIASLSISSPAGAATTVLEKGITSTYVGDLQTYLKTSKIGEEYNYSGGFTDYFGPVTEKALKKWQKATGNQPTGQIAINSPEWSQLVSQTTLPKVPAKVDIVSVAEAVQTGWAIDASEPAGWVTVLHYIAASHTLAEPVSTQAAFGGRALNADYQWETYSTPTGIFHINKDWPGDELVSHAFFNSPMDNAACFIGLSDVCIHLDGMNPSHGCIHVGLSASIFIVHLSVGTPVVVHD